MKAVTKIIFFDDAGEKFFGEGPCRILHAVDTEGSLHAAATSMGMAYSKAHRIIQNAEKALGFPLTIKIVGGKAGGGSRLTQEGREWLQKYEEYRDACVRENNRLYQEFFQS